VGEAGVDGLQWRRITLQIAALALATGLVGLMMERSIELYAHEDTQDAAETAFIWAFFWLPLLGGLGVRLVVGRWIGFIWVAIAPAANLVTVAVMDSWGSAILLALITPSRS
jgi:hypothetical protein